MGAIGDEVKMKHLIYIGLGACVLSLVGALLAFIGWVYTMLPENFQVGFLCGCWLLFMSYIFGYLTYETAIKHRLEKRK
jgi:hypothetical protein